ncbi:MAG: hypothetical protein AAF658_06270, partial [Myxococcota bacterium]
DDDGDPFGRTEIGVPLDGQDELYAGVEQRTGAHEEVFRATSGQSILLGGRRRLADGTRLYAEQRLSTDATERQVARSVGVDLPAGPSRFFLTYARSGFEDEDGRARARDGITSGFAFGGSALRARVSLDARRDGGDETLYALGGSTRIDYVPEPGLAFAFGLRGGENFDESRSVLRSWEGTAGFAWRTLPALTWFGRVAFDIRRGENDNTRTGIAATALAYDLHRTLTIGPKLSFRRTRAVLEEQRLLDEALLAALRADFHVAESWDVAVEGRSCSTPGADIDTDYGALTEVSLLVLRWLRIGAGYNFSPIGAGGVQCRSPTARGVFIRAEALY